MTGLLRRNKMADSQDQVQDPIQDPMLAAVLRRTQARNAEASTSTPVMAPAATSAPAISTDDPMLKAVQARQQITAGEQAGLISGADAEDIEYGKQHPLADEYAKSFGLKGAHVSIGDAASELIHGLGDSVSKSNEQSAKWAGEGRFGPAALALTVPNLIVNGIEGIANLFEQGTPMVVSGLRNGDDETAYRGMGKLLAGITQMQMMRDKPGTTIGQKLTAYDPKNLQEATSGTGTSSPMNVLQGSINRSIGTAVRDVRYGDPSKALVDNGITSPTTTGRIQGVTTAINKIKPQVDAALAASPKQIDIIKVLDPIVKKATQEVNDSFEKPEAKLSALEDINALWMNALRKAPSGMADLITANEIKQGIGDAFNWEKRPTAMMPYAESAFRTAYGSVKQAINQAVPDVAPLNENLSNLLSAKKALSETFLKEATGAGPEASFSLRQMASAMIGKLAPWAIRKAQAASTIGPTIRAGVSASTAAGNANQEKQDDPFAQFGGKLHSPSPSGNPDLTIDGKTK